MSVSAEIEELASELTGTTGMSDAPEPGEPLPNNVAADLEAYEQHQAEQGLQPDAEEGRDPHRKTVPLGALQEERTRRQQLQAQLQQVAEHNAAMQAQYQQALAQQQAALQAQQQAAAEASMPAFSEDPEGYIKAREQQFQQALEQMQNNQLAEQQSRQLAAHVTAEMENARTSVEPLEAEFMAEHPDYPEAWAVVGQDVAAKLQQQYPGASPGELQFLQTVAALQFLKGCQAQGINPAEHVYRKALSLGHRAGQRAPNAAPRQAQPVHQVSQPSLQDIAAMDDAQFDAFFAQMKRGSLVGPAV